MEGNNLQNSAIPSNMYSYTELALKLGMARSTLGRELSELKKKGVTFKPDHVQEMPSYRIHFFHVDRLPQFKAALDSLGKKRRKK